MMRLRPPRGMTLGLVADGHAIRVMFPLRVWTLAESALPKPVEFWSDGLERRDDHISLRIPVAPMTSPEWRNTKVALATFREIVSALSVTDLSELAENDEGQLLWIDSLVLFAERADISVLASAEFAAFVRDASQDVFDRVNGVLLVTERRMTGKIDTPLTRVVSRAHGVLYLSVGDDCACLGVANLNLPRSEQEGWEAHGHNLRFVSRILLVLVALAALEDECRALRVM